MSKETNSHKIKFKLKIFVYICFLSLFFVRASWAQTSLDTTVSAQVGDFRINLSGYVAPYASIALFSNQNSIANAAADENGHFLFTGLLLNNGSTNICFDAVDFRRLGESYSCINLNSREASESVEDIFLPPTLGLLRSEITERSSTIAYGYSMPLAEVSLSFAGSSLTVTADQDGYYEFMLKDVKAGVYELSTNARLAEKKSLEPEKKVTLKSLSQIDATYKNIVEPLPKLRKKSGDLLTSINLDPLWLTIPIFILIIILLKKLYPKAFSFISAGKLLSVFSNLFKRRKKHLHHYWMLEE